MEEVDILRLVLASIFGITAVILSFYADTVGVSMMVAAGIALLLNYILRKLIYKEKTQ